MRPFTLAAIAVLGLLSPLAAAAQTPPAPPTAGVTFAEQRPAASRGAAPGLSNRLQIRPFGTAALTWFTASSTFKAVLGSSTGQEYGGGLNLTQGPGYLEIGARRFSKDGERVFVFNGQAFPLGIPAKVTMTPLEITAGWRFGPRFGRVIPHVGAGYTRMTYEETSDFADDSENVSESFNGFHVVAGTEVRITRWVGVIAEGAWTSIAKALGDGGASKAYGEDNLGGTSIRLKLVIGH